MSTPANGPSTYFRKSWQAVTIAIALGVILGAVGLYLGERLGPVKRYVLFFQPLVIGYALGRVHQLADQRRLHSDPRGPKGK